jgi:glycerophosphoryl diester phosphodiesterase
MIPAIEAHRGDSANAPENTLAAFRRAVELQAPWIELDVHPARDGTLMVLHDDTVDRTTNGSGAVCGMTIDELSRLDAGSWFAASFAGEGIPQLVQVLEMVAPTDTRLNVEIKSSPSGLDVPRALVDLLRRYGREGRYVVSSFDLAALLQVRAIAPEVALALIGQGPEILVHARRHRLPWIHAHRGTLDKELVAQAHASGISVNVWTVDDPALLAFWRSTGVDKLCTNRPAMMLAAQRCENEMSAELET